VAYLLFCGDECAGWRAESGETRQTIVWRVSDSDQELCGVIAPNSCYPLWTTTKPTSHPTVENSPLGMPVLHATAGWANVNLRTISCARATLRMRRPTPVVRYEQVKQHRRCLSRSGHGKLFYLDFVFDRLVKIDKIVTGNIGHFPTHLYDFIDFSICAY
jgi:hypothetical protein